MISKQGKISLYSFFRYYSIPEFNPWWFSILHTFICYLGIGYLIWLYVPLYAVPFVLLGVIGSIGRFILNTHINTEEDSVKKRLFHRERLEFPPWTILYLLGVVSLLFLIYRFVFGLPRQLNVTFCALYSLYWVFLFYLGTISIEKDESKFFTHIYSPNKILWEGASIAFENGDNQFDEKNFYRSFYYFWVAERRYKTLSNKEEREPYKTIAKLQGEAAQLSKEAILNPQESEEYFRKANEVMEKVLERSKYRLCTNCDSSVKVENCNIFVTDDGLIDQIICNDCYTRDRTNNRETDKSTTNKSSKRTNNQTSSQSTSNKNTNNRKQKKEKTSRNTHTSSQKPKTQTITLSEACELLGIEKDSSLSEKEVKKAFKQKVFEYHPDHGGSLEEFMRLKKARDHIIRYIDTGD